VSAPPLAKKTASLIKNRNIGNVVSHEVSVLNYLKQMKKPAVNEIHWLEKLQVLITKSQIIQKFQFPMTVSGFEFWAL